MAIYEVMPITEEVRDAILRSAPTAELREIAQSQGMKSLRQSGLVKVLAGTTTIEEVLRVTLAYRAASPAGTGIGAVTRDVALRCGRMAGGTRSPPKHLLRLLWRSIAQGAPTLAVVRADPMNGLEP